MLRARCVLALGTIGAGLLTGPVRADGTRPPGALFSVELPGGLQGALATLDDRTAPDRARFLFETIRRFNSRRPGGQAAIRDPALQSLLDHLKRAFVERQALDDTVPLPLPPALWQSAVFGGRELPYGLVAAILETRNAALLYNALLALDDETRSWLATQPELVAELARVHAPAFVLAAPGLRVREGVVQVPGGRELEPMWQALVDERPGRAAPFILALLGRREGRLAYFYGAVGGLPDKRLRLAFDLEAPDAEAHRAAGRRLLEVFERLAAGWRIRDWPFSLPGLDPAALAAELPTDDEGHPRLVGTRRFWTLVFADRADPADAPAAAAGQLVEFAWLAAHVYESDPDTQRRRMHAVLFASRHLEALTPETAPDALAAVRAVIHQPALAAALDRGGGLNVRAAAAAARAAEAVSSAGDERRAARALAQLQGALFVLTRAAVRGALPDEVLPRVVASVAAVPLTERGDYEGGMVRALDTVLRQHAPQPAAEDEEGCTHGGAAGDPGTDLQEGLLRLAAGCAGGERQTVEWEGTRYRVDLGGAEARRMAHFLGEPPRPLVASAWHLLHAADRLGAPALSRDALNEVADALERVGAAVEWDAGGWPADVPSRAREAGARLGRSPRGHDAADARGVAPLLRVLADDLLAKGLLELAYAAALGSPERAPILAGDVAARHDYGRRPNMGRRQEWQIPVAGTGRDRTWHVTGSLLGLDVALSPFSLVRLSTRPPSRRPTVPEELQRGLAEAVALVSPAQLTRGGLQQLRAALERARAEIAALSEGGRAGAVADRAGLGSADRSLLAWVVREDRDRLAAFLTPGELLTLGLEVATASDLDAWGAPARMRQGCLCLRMPSGARWESLAGRGVSGLVTGAFPDLTIRLAELLAELEMPPAMLAAVLGPATADLLDHAVSRDADDRRGLVEFVQGLDASRVEEYLALLTSGGPLVPVDGETGTAMNGEVQ